jgi:hypothetical protein
VHPLHPLKNSVSNNTDSDTHGKYSVSSRCTLFAPMDAPIRLFLFLGRTSATLGAGRQIEPTRRAHGVLRPPGQDGVDVRPFRPFRPFRRISDAPPTQLRRISDAADAADQRHALVHAVRAPLGAPLGARGLSCDRCTHDLPPFSVSVATEDAKGCKGCKGCRFSTKVPFYVYMPSSNFVFTMSFSKKMHPLHPSATPSLRHD